jgi:hypothetical protein
MARGQQGENELPPYFVDAPAFELRGDAAIRHRAAALATADAGLRARLGFFFLQMSLPSSSRARSALSRL